MTSNFTTEEIKDWKEYLSVVDREDDLRQFRKLSSTGRPMGDESFVAHVETITGRRLKKTKPGRKNKEN